MLTKANLDSVAKITVMIEQQFERGLPIAQLHHNGHIYAEVHKEKDGGYRVEPIDGPPNRIIWANLQAAAEYVARTWW